MGINNPQVAFPMLKHIHRKVAILTLKYIYRQVELRHTYPQAEHHSWIQCH
jgi:hypothetical protein